MHWGFLLKRRVREVSYFDIANKVNIVKLIGVLVFLTH